ncbi:hypothetical protein [Burkholderia plantarii]|uniref:hypothetical protein n=1 Tax=Burkholderia plantarii TaxID=41899 RepID=UPI0018DDA00A|nr:hypothetical protein [Burkholderia plantarii]MBI0329303.1 hypothetical protein [Burkholderia plantarii]
MAVIEIVPLAFTDPALPFTAARRDRSPARQEGTIAFVRTARPGVVCVAIAWSGVAAGRHREPVVPCAGRRCSRLDRRPALRDRASGADAGTRLPRGHPSRQGLAGPSGHPRGPDGSVAHCPFEKPPTRMRGSP